MQQSIDGKLLPNDYWLHSTINCLQTEVNYHPVSSGVTCGQHVEFLDRNYSYKSVYNQITKDAGLEPIRHTNKRHIKCTIVIILLYNIVSVMWMARIITT